MSGPWGTPTPPPPARRPASRLGVTLWLGAIALGIGLVVALNKLFPGNASEGDMPGILYTLGFLALASTVLLRTRTIRWKQTAAYVGLWLAVGMVALLGFAYQDELLDAGLRLRGAVMPSYAIQTGDHRLEIAEGENGYGVYGTVNGAQVHFTIDTGASDVVLSPSDARKAGLDPDGLAYDRPVGTANGIGHGASVELKELTVGGIRFTNLRASVNRAEMGDSLLGMAFLRRLKSFSFANRKLVLTW